MGTPFTSTHIYHITDTYDKRASGKIDGAYTKHRGAIGIVNAGYTLTPIDNSIDGGITVSEFITNSQRPDRLIIAVNYAPPDNKKGTADNHRRDFFCAELRSGDVVCGTVNGYEFSYIKPEITQLFRLTNTNNGSQFRSLEVLTQHTLLFSEPEHRSRLIATGILERFEDIDAIIPNVPDTTHVHEIDNFQNVKLIPSIADLAALRQWEWRDVDFGFGEASIEIESPNKRARHDYKGIVAPTLFAAPEGTNVVALRSSSRRLNFETNVPIIATIRQRPAETDPTYTPPTVGAPVWLRRHDPSLRIA